MEEKTTHGTFMPMADIHADEEFNCRGTIAPIDVIEIAKSIEEHGLISPVVIMQYTEEEAERNGKKYLLIAGYRRFTAHKVLERTEIEVIIRPHMDESQARVLNLAENLDRKELNILQEARAIKRLRDLGMTETATAKELKSVSRGWVQIRFMLLDLPEEVQMEAAGGIISQTDIRELYSVQGSSERIAAAKRIKEARARGDKRALSKAVRTKKRSDKRLRKKGEILDMQEHIREHLGNGIGTRSLAWVAGEISDLELFLDIKHIVEGDSGDYSVPQDGDY